MKNKNHIKRPYDVWWVDDFLSEKQLDIIETGWPSTESNLWYHGHKTINGKQVGVPNALQAFLGDDENVSIALGLNINDDSPFYGRITRTTMTMNHEIGLPHLFALHSIGRNVSRSFQHGSLEDLDNDVNSSLPSSISPNSF